MAQHARRGGAIVVIWWQRWLLPNMYRWYTIHEARRLVKLIDGRGSHMTRFKQACSYGCTIPEERRDSEDNKTDRKKVDVPTKQSTYNGPTRTEQTLPDVSTKLLFC